MSARTGLPFTWGSLLLLAAACGGSESSTSPPPPPPAAPAVAMVDVTPATGTLEVGRTLALVATPRDAQGNALNKPVSWSTTNAAVATVSATGLVSAVTAGGPVSITATSDGKAGSAAITVILNIARIALNKTALSFDRLGAKDTLIATAYNDQNAAVPNVTFTWSSSQFYFNSTSAGLPIQQGYSALSTGTADFAAIDSHGFWGAGGQLTIAAVESTPTRTIFYWSSGCAIGDLDHADNFLTSMLYSPVSDVLVAKGTTNNSGGMGNNQNGFYGRNVATAMSSGASFGAAVTSHVNVPLIAPWSTDREFHFGTAIILGDPTLRLRP